MYGGWAVRGVVARGSARGEQYRKEHARLTVAYSNGIAHNSLRQCTSDTAGTPRERRANRVERKLRESAAETVATELCDPITTSLGVDISHMRGILM